MKRERIQQQLSAAAANVRSGGPFNLASAALLPTSRSYESSTPATGSYWSSSVWQGPGLAQVALGLSSPHLSFPLCCLSPCCPPFRG